MFENLKILWKEKFPFSLLLATFQPTVDEAHPLYKFINNLGAFFFIVSTLLANNSLTNVVINACKKTLKITTQTSSLDNNFHCIF